MYSFTLNCQGYYNVIFIHVHVLTIHLEKLFYWTEPEEKVPEAVVTCPISRELEASAISETSKRVEQSTLCLGWRRETSWGVCHY